MDDPENKEEPVPVKMSFGQRMAEAKRLRKQLILNKIVREAEDAVQVTEPTKPITDENAREELYRRLKDEKAKVESNESQIAQLKKAIGGQRLSDKDPLDVLDAKPNELNSFEKAFTGWGAGAIWFIRTVGPIILFLGVLYYIWNTYKTWIQQNWGMLFDGLAYLSLFVGGGNILYDILQKSGQLKPSVKFMSNSPKDILLLKPDKKEKAKEDKT